MSTSNNLEIELKLSCTPATAKALLPLLSRISHCVPQKLHLQNTYYDTATQALRQSGAALRVRRQGKVLLQTVKCSGQVKGGLSSRPEWETPYRGHFDFSSVSNNAVRAQLETLSQHPGFQATLNTDFSRMVWEYRPAADTYIQIMLDQGRIVAGKQQTPICELEIELVGGHPKHLFALAQQLCAELPLFPAPLSKAARGSLLLDGRGLTHHKIPAPPAGSTTLDKAFAVLLQDSLDHISHHLPSNCDPFTADDLHQVRVGLRHMLALLSMFKPWLRKAWYQANKNGAHQHLQALANARDHYILLNETCMAVHQSTQQKPLRAQLKTQADKTFTAAKEYLLGQTFATWLLDCSLSLHTHSLVSKRAKALQWSDIAPSLLRKKLKAYAKVLQQVQHGTLALHSLRIQTKYLRYQYALLGNKPTALLKQLGELQDALGEISDLNSAGAILLPLAKSQRNLVPAITALGGWHLSRHPQRLHALSEQKRKLCKTLKHVQRKAK